MAMLEVNHLAIQFGGLRAVDGFNVSIEKGQLYGLIGPNVEGFLARGDRRCSKVILKAYEKGALYDAWSESFHYDIWKEAFKETGVDIEFYTLRERSTDEILPWDFIDAGVTKKFLIREWEQAKAETVTPNCRQKCSGCGVLKYKGGVCCESKN